MDYLVVAQASRLCKRWLNGYEPIAASPGNEKFLLSRLSQKGCKPYDVLLAATGRPMFD
jgi:hypothetical protein